MIREICRDTILLSCKAETARAEDLETAKDLRDTLAAHRDECVGMAANMIGIPKSIIAFMDGPQIEVMLNPVITFSMRPYQAVEGCLSLNGTRKTKRFQAIEVTWQDEALQPHKKVFAGMTAQIIQHECDHLEGILI